MSQPSDRLDRSFLALIFVLVTGAVLALINTTIVGVAIGQIGAEFDAGLGTLSWVGTAYVLAIAVAIPLSGWATVRYGLRRTWMVALSLFTLGSAATALALSLGMVIGARAVQGIGGGMLEPIMLTAIAQAAGPARMGKAMGITSGAIGLGPLIGPLLGGTAVQLLDWRWMFACFIPLALLALLLSRRVLPPSESAPRRLDVGGLALISFGAVGVLYGLSQGSHPDGIDGRGWLAIIAGFGLLVGYVVWARRYADQPIVSLGPVAVRGFLPAAVVMLLLGTAIYPLFYGLPQFFQSALGYGELGSGLLLAPHGIGALVGMVLGGRLSDRHSTRLLVTAGGGATAVGSLAYVIAGPDAALGTYVLASLVGGLGTGFVGGPTVSSLYRVLPPAEIPAGSTLLFILNQLGGALGIALMSVLISSAADGATTWTAAAGTVPMLLPTLGAVLIIALAVRLPSTRKAADVVSAA